MAQCGMVWHSQYPCTACTEFCDLKELNILSENLNFESTRSPIRMIILLHTNVLFEPGAFALANANKGSAESFCCVCLLGYLLSTF